MSALVHAPVWRHKETGNEVVLLGSQYVADNHDDAFNIMLGMMLVEGVILGLERIEVRAFDPAHTPHVPAQLGHNAVIIVGGPSFSDVPVCDNCNGAKCDECAQTGKRVTTEAPHA